jgi:hypothetical protein
METALDADSPHAPASTGGLVTAAVLVFAALVLNAGLAVWSRADRKPIEARLAHYRLEADTLGKVVGEVVRLRDGKRDAEATIAAARDLRARTWDAGPLFELVAGAVPEKASLASMQVDGGRPATVRLELLVADPAQANAVRDALAAAAGASDVALAADGAAGALLRYRLPFQWGVR